MANSDLIYKLSEGNPGALTVLTKLDRPAMTLLKQMGITGSMIWVAYKDICKEDIETLKDKIFDHSIEKLVKDTPDYKWLQKQQRSIRRIEF